MSVNLNAEELKQVLEAHKKRRCAVCPLHKEEIMQLNRSCGTMIAENCLALVKSYEDKIFAFENRLKECENGYEGTLFLDRCKLHDAEEKVKELTQANDMISESYDHLEKTKDNLLAERARLILENERLRKSYADYEETTGLNKVREDTARKMQERLKAEMSFGRYIQEDTIDQIAKEMLEEGK